MQPVARKTSPRNHKPASTSVCHLGHPLPGRHADCLFLPWWGSRCPNAMPMPRGIPEMRRDEPSAGLCVPDTIRKQLAPKARRCEIDIDSDSCSQKKDPLPRIPRIRLPLRDGGGGQEAWWVDGIGEGGSPSLPRIGRVRVSHSPTVSSSSFFPFALRFSTCARCAALLIPPVTFRHRFARTRLLDPMFSVSRLCADDVLARSSHCRGRCIGRAIWDEPPVGTDKCLSALLPGTSSSLFSRLLTRFDGAGMGFVAPSARPGNQTPPPSPISGTEGKRSCGRGRGGIPDM